MTRDTLEKRISEILDGVVVLGSMVEQAILGAVKSMVDKDLVAAQRIYDADKEINHKRYQLEEETIGLIARQQPVARDVRILTAVLEVLTELERMGDYAKGIANINIMIGNEPYIKPLIDIPKMADKTVDLLHRSIRAFVEGDEEAARSIPTEDDEVDTYYYAIYKELIGIVTSDPSTVDQANYLLWAAHNLERTADRVTNLCERTIYVLTGELADLDVSDDELRQKK
jgi:phosphate transport system protein